MSNWVLRAAEDHLLPVYEELHRQLVKREALHAGEATLQVLHEPGKKAQTKSCMWLYRTGRDGGPPIVLYEYQSSRKAAHAEKFLEGFPGISTPTATRAAISCRGISEQLLPELVRRPTASPAKRVAVGKEEQGS